jgi:hypothetical protein
VPSAAVLGDGRRVRVRHAALPAAFGLGDTVGFVVIAPPRSAVRSLVMPGAPRLEIGQAPPALEPCGGFTIFSSTLFDDRGGPGPGGDVDVAAPGAPSLFVRDEEERLCIAVGRTTRSNECGEPGPWLSSSLMNVSNDRTIVGGAVDPRVAAVRVSVSDGTTFDVATHRGEAYAGRYAGRLAYFSAVAPEGRRVTGVDLIDERGQVLLPAGYVDRRLARRARPLLRARGARGPFVIAAAPLERGGRTDFVASCMFITRGPLPRAGAECHEILPQPLWLDGFVDCRHRRTIVVVGLTRGVSRARAQLADGSRVPLAIRRGPEGERVAILVAGPRAGVRSLTLRWPSGAGRERYRLRVPPAARQCGYRFSQVGGRDG